jgi:nucleoside-diphosphate-sugar epimerase
LACLTVSFASLTSAKSRAFSIAKARRLLGYAPRVDVDEGVARTAAWYRKAGWL